MTNPKTVVTRVLKMRCPNAEIVSGFTAVVQLLEVRIGRGSSSPLWLTAFIIPVSVSGITRPALLEVQELCPESPHCHFTVDEQFAETVVSVRFETTLISIEADSPFAFRTHWGCAGDNREGKKQDG